MNTRHLNTADSRPLPLARSQFSPVASRLGRRAVIRTPEGRFASVANDPAAEGNSFRRVKLELVSGDTPRWTPTVLDRLQAPLTRYRD